MAPLRSCRAGRRRAPGLARVRSRANTATSAASGPAAPVRVEAAGGGMGGVGGGTGLMCGGVDHGRCGGGDDAQAPVRSCRAGRDRGDGAHPSRPGCEAGQARDVRRPRARRGTASVEAAGGGMGGVGGGTGWMCGGVDAAATTMRRLRSGAARPGETGETARTRAGPGAKPRRLIPIHVYIQNLS